MSQYQQQCINLTHGTQDCQVLPFQVCHQTCIYKLAEELDIEVVNVVLPPPVLAWFFEYLDNFDTSSSALESCVEIVKDNAG